MPQGWRLVWERAMGNDRSRAVLLAVLGGLLAGVGLIQGSPFWMISALALLWDIGFWPVASALWGGIAVLVSHGWLLSLHPLTWMGVPALLSLPVALTIWLSCGLSAALLVASWAWLNSALVRLLSVCGSSGFACQGFHVLLMATLWGLGEVVLAYSPLFWIGIGASLIPGDIWLAGLARSVGSPGLAMLLIVIGWWLRATAIAIHRRLGWQRLLVFGTVLLLLLHVWGWTLLRPSAASESLPVAVWQPAIPTRSKFSEEQLKQLPMAISSVLDSAAAQKAAWLMAPEGTLPAGKPLMSKAPLPFLTGGFRWVNGHQRSGILVFSKGDREASKAIDKHRLVPIGEWLPTWLANLTPGLSAVGGLSPGDSSRLLQWPGPAAAVAICYELSNGSAIAEAVAEGGKWILAVANLDPYPMALQREFLALAKLRSIETSRDLVSVANTGPSALISAVGQSVQIVAPMRAGLGVATLHLHDELSFYARWREWPLLTLLLLSTSGLAWCMLSNKTKGHV